LTEVSRAAVMRKLTKSSRITVRTKVAAVKHMILAVLVTITATASVAAGGQSSARSVAMAGAYSALAEGVDASRHNPANLGLNDYRRTGVELFGLGASIVNNAFTLGDYNKYTGALLTGSDKNDILSCIPDEGLKLSGKVEASVLSATYRNFGFVVTGVGAADVNLSRDIFELVLNGNAFADTIDVIGSYSEAVSYVSIGFSYGTPVYSAGTRQLALGAGVKYLRGIAIEEVTDLEGLISTEATGFEGEGRMTARTASGGTGYAFDVGASLKLNDSYTVGIAVTNILSHISWNKDAQEHGYLFAFDTMTIDNVDEDYVVSDEYSRPVESFSTALPAVMTVGVAKRSRSVNWAVDWEQGLSRGAGASTRPRLCLGAEWWPITAIPVRTGCSAGGGKSLAFSFGSGVRLASFYFDYALVSGTAFSGYSAKGLNLAISTGIQF